MGSWLIFGDFNIVRYREERSNSQFYFKTATDFNNFITNIRLLDLNMGGSKFTYFGNFGEKLC